MLAHNLFDTLKFTQGAESIGIKREHAEYLAEQIALHRGSLISKVDLQAELKTLQTELIHKSDTLRSELRHDLSMLRNDLEHALVVAQREMLIRLGIMITAGFSAMTAILHFFGK
jgi:hypothetical protein